MQKIFRLQISTWVCSFLLVIGMTSSALAAPAAVQSSGEDWKGLPDNSIVSLGGLGGLGIVGSSVGFALLGTAGVKIIKHGFVPDINDSVTLETELGPLFLSGMTLFDYALHLRWDFQKDDTWTFFALGGFAGDISGSSVGNQFFPSFGVGTFFRVNDLIQIRGEISHEHVAAGVTVPFYL
jgi:hypothetical protein